MGLVMKKYKLVETYLGNIIGDNSSDSELHQTLLMGAGSLSEICFLEVPELGENESDEHLIVNGDPGTPGEGPGASALSLSYDEDAHKAACLSKIRGERDKRLKNTDYTQLADAPLQQAQKDNWAIYRQELRDVPENTADPRLFDFENDWPDEPMV